MKHLCFAQPHQTKQTKVKQLKLDAHDSGDLIGLRRETRAEKCETVSEMRLA